ncbi:ATP-binding cassette domain-containing protein [Candidatus Bipolaricaulota bacterium]|nr:ATP-binding cassette domain-containing protein [Candidatus Bipolaricaulota bacterium]
MDEPIVFLNAVSTTYEGEFVPALSHITLCLRAGDRLAVVGPNGAGKTTLLEVVNGLLPATKGQVHVFGQSIARHGHRLRARIAYMAQDMFFDASTPFLAQDVVASVQYGQIGVFHWPSRADKQRVCEALEAVDVIHLRRRPIGRLSGGQQRKILLARALAQGARLLLLDEPTANLDPEAKLDVARIVCDVEDRLDASTIVVSHEGGPLLDDAQRLARIEAGTITHEGPMDALRQHLIGQAV